MPGRRDGKQLQPNDQRMPPRHRSDWRIGSSIWRSSIGTRAFNSLLKASWDYFRFASQVIRDRHVDPDQIRRVLEDDPVHHPTFTLLLGSVPQSASLAQSLKKLADTGVGMSVLAILAISDISFDGWDQVPAKAKAALNMDVDDKAFFRAIQQFERDGVQYFSGELRRLFAG